MWLWPRARCGRCPVTSSSALNWGRHVPTPAGRVNGRNKPKKREILWLGREFVVHRKRKREGAFRNALDRRIPSVPRNKDQGTTSTAVIALPRPPAPAAADAAHFRRQWKQKTENRKVIITIRSSQCLGPHYLKFCTGRV